jgi:uncharacterized membrane protein
MVIRNEIFPLRAKLGNKTQLELSVEIENEDDKSKKISLEIELPKEATFNPLWTNTIYKKKFDNFKPFEKFKVKIPIYLSRMAEAGNYKGNIIVCEHFNEFGVVERVFKKEILFRIVN